MNLIADLHMHTLASGHAYNTLMEMVKKSAEKKLQVIAITDHGPQMPGASHEYYFGNLLILPDYIYDVRVLKGCEANILNDGSLDLPEYRLENLEFVAAGIHPEAEFDLTEKKDITKSMLATINKSYVKMITHPDNPKFPVDFDEISHAAYENNVILELNAGSFDKFKIGRRGVEEVTLKYLQAIKKYNVKISINSDAHYIDEIGRTSGLEKLVQKVGIKEENILNNNKERLLKYLNLK
ncbi:phosphatase [Oceanotoga sp. DSM 15011]|uniref:Hydrolase n=1 Tax=Oceanotoga teriensis TaxID=515440 RepID=A0AA45C5C0_9BACT|nr:MULTISPECIES: phosphatase [Oceanotoga]MDN5342985.1 putative hydrolase [Oceanotoga sp.]MDO7976172.1 phosphatase [Oceanotoga teriensis]PWJ88525.1 putative hydrolase [Oceanotoga teriensis]UYP01008.1 phosphatase [Oceanotoga sp. DSM 15011]